MPEIDSYNGVRTVIRELAKLCKFYLTHRGAVALVLPVEAITALDTLATLCPVIIALDIAGPN